MPALHSTLAYVSPIRIEQYWFATVEGSRIMSPLRDTERKGKIMRFGLMRL